MAGSPQPTQHTSGGAGSQSATGPAFVADAMLGRLAKWLRLMGYDTLYARRETDHQIAAIARAQGRIVLTRDRELTRRRGIRCQLIHSEIFEEQMAEIAAAFGLPAPGSQPRCPVCNAQLESVNREEARPHVPVYVYQTQRRFHRCRSCARYYWAGTHWQHVEQTLARLRASVEAKKR